MLIRDRYRGYEHGSVSPLIDGRRSRCGCSDDNRHAVHRRRPPEFYSSFLKLGKQGRYCTGECTKCQAIQGRGTWKGEIEDPKPFQDASRHHALHWVMMQCGSVQVSSNAARSRPIRAIAGDRLNVGTDLLFTMVILRVARAFLLLHYHA